MARDVLQLRDARRADLRIDVALPIVQDEGVDGVVSADEDAELLVDVILEERREDRRLHLGAEFSQQLSQAHEHRFGGASELEGQELRMRGLRERSAVDLPAQFLVRRLVPRVIGCVLAPTLVLVIEGHRIEVTLCVDCPNQSCLGGQHGAGIVPAMSQQTECVASFARWVVPELVKHADQRKSEETFGRVVQAAQAVIVDDGADHPLVDRQDPSLRLDLLSGEDPAHRPIDGQQRVLNQ